MENKEKFEQYKKLLIDWSKKINLVAKSTLSDIDQRHIADSAQLADFIPKNTFIIDLGSGAGFPAVVLAIMGWKVTCIESIGKKTDFLIAVKNELGLTNLQIYHGRVENFIKTLPRDSEYIFTARAFAPLVKILDYVHNVNYRLFLLKGHNITEEIMVAKQKYKFKHTLYPSKTGDGFITIIQKGR